MNDEHNPRERGGFPPGVSVSRDPGPARPRRATSVWTRHPRQVAPLVVCLPVFNASHQLADCLRSLEGAVDAVIALDDGSDDDSQSLLRQHSLVKEVLIKPPKAPAEWDDAENRREL